MKVWIDMAEERGRTKGDQGKSHGTKERIEMRCKECRKKIILDHHVVVNQSDPSRERLHLVFKCDCGIYVIPLDRIETAEFKGWVSSGEMVHQKLSGDQTWNAGKLSRQAKKIYRREGEVAYEKWKEAVYFPWVDSRTRRTRIPSLRKGSKMNGPQPSRS